MIEIPKVDLIEFKPIDDNKDEKLDKIILQLNSNHIDDTSSNKGEKSALLIADRKKRADKIIKLADTSSCNKDEIKHVQELIEYNPYVFGLDGEPLKATNVLEHEIPTTTDKPIVAKGVRLPPKLQEHRRSEVQKYLELGVIRPSTSPYSSNTWIVPKQPGPNGEKRW